MTGTINPTLPVAGEPNSTADPKVLGSLKTLRDEINALLDSSNKIPNTSLSQSKVTWYTPTIVATEESRTNTAYGTLTTPDEIKAVVVPANGLIVVGYMARVKASVAAAASASLFLGANAVKVPSGTNNSAGTSGTAFNVISSSPLGLASSLSGEIAAFVTTGQSIGWSPEAGAGLCTIFAAAGTYDISVQFKATSGSVTAKERKLWAYVLGA